MTDPMPRILVPSGADHARVAEVLLGGDHALAVDRAAAIDAAAAVHSVWRVEAARRAFLGAVIESTVSAGLSQVLHLGAGVPHPGSVPDLAGVCAPDVLYVGVEPDPVNAEVLAQGTNHQIVHADPADVETVLTAAPCLDWAAPVAIVVGWGEHLAAAPATLRQWRQRCAPGSVLAVAHLVTGPDSTGAGPVAVHLAVLARHGCRPAQTRSVEEIGELLGATEPGWEADAPVAPALSWADTAARFTPECRLATDLLHGGVAWAVR